MKSLAVAAVVVLLAVLALEVFAHRPRPGLLPMTVSYPSPFPTRMAAPAMPTATPRITVGTAPPSARPVVAPPDATPRIIAIAISTPVAVGGQVVTGTVTTSTNVASVEARIAGYSSALTKTGAGRFMLSYQVPKLPFFLHRTYSIEVIARTARGDSVSSSLPITVR